MILDADAGYSSKMHTQELELLKRKIDSSQAWHGLIEPMGAAYLRNVHRGVSL